jgi:uncharacterized protein
VPEQLLFRFVWPQKVFAAMPTTLVERSADRVVLWLAPGTPVTWPPGFHLTIPELAAGDWTHVERRWYGGGRLLIAERGTPYSIYVMWDEVGELQAWYVNLEDPWRETRLGFDTTDHLLDVWIDPDRSWRWKDEDHLEEAVEIGLFSAEQASRFRAAGEHALERVEAWSAPFNEGWEDWRPDPSWPVPELPEGWERL